MRKALIAVIAAAVLFAVGAFAASLTVSSENVASGNDSIEACATAVSVQDWITTAPDGASDDDYLATDVDVVLTQAAIGACAGAEVDLAVLTDNSSSTQPSGWANTDCTTADTAGADIPFVFDCNIADTEVGPIVEVAVLVNGDSYDVAAP